MIEPALELAVGDFAENLEKLIKSRPSLGNIAIRGEITEWNPQTDGAVYFKIKDQRAALECYAFASDARRFPKVENGLAVVAQGSIEIRFKRSSYQLLTRSLAITGAGTAYAEYLALVKKLGDEGLFEPSRKRVVPRYPRRVGLISAKRDAAEDFRTILQQKAPYVGVAFFQSRVGGDGAEIDMLEAIERAERSGVDVVVITRGGGSDEEFKPFNTEALARGIFRAKLPIITAIGHTRNRTIADFVADVAAETPTRAVDVVAAGWVDAVNRLRNLEVRLDERIRRYMLHAIQSKDLLNEKLGSGLQRSFSRQRDRLNAVERRLAAQNPAARLTRRAEHLSALRARLPAAWQQNFMRRSARLAAVGARLDALDPQAPLERGYALVFKDGVLVRSASDVSAGDTIDAKLAHGMLWARVEGSGDES